MSLKIANATMARVESSFRQLASASQELNTASEDLAKVIRHLDASLKKLGLGVSAWVPVSGTSDDTQYWTVELGYTKAEGKWGLALREVTGFHLDKNDESEQVWAFNEAPRTQRAEAVEKIPDLLDKLLQHTQEATRELREKIDQAAEFNTVVAELTPDTAPPAPQQFHRPAVSPLPVTTGARKNEEEHGGNKASAPAFREPQPLPVERVPVERSAAANSAPQAVPRFREEESSAQASSGLRPASAARVL